MPPPTLEQAIPSTTTHPKRVSMCSSAQPCASSAKALHQSAFLHGFTDRVRTRARDFLHGQLNQASALPCDLPADLNDLQQWMQQASDVVVADYNRYLARRKSGGAREYFSSRAHALYFLRAVAPTKVVDGAWLYATAGRWADSRFNGLLRTYLEELGDGDPSKNHVLLYRKLLESHGLEQWQDLPDDFYLQGAIQLALGMHGDDLVPEMLGFNLGYEQLPLHLLVCSYELNELGIDPYYFQLHVTVDNGDTGHARRAVDAVRDLTPLLGDKAQFDARVRRGYQLNALGVGTLEVIHRFDLEGEAMAIFQRKSIAGTGAHSDYCKVAGRTINDWLAEPSQVPYFIDALKRAGWITLGQPPEECRFWKLLQGPRAEMFGVFNAYELQVIYDWLRGPQSVDGRAYTAAGSSPASGEPSQCQPPFRALARRRQAPGMVDTGVDGEVQEVQALANAAMDTPERMQLLAEVMSPLHHWKPAGLKATQLFSGALLAG
jgi:hypothetical protein